MIEQQKKPCLAKSVLPRHLLFLNILTRFKENNFDNNKNKIKLNFFAQQQNKTDNDDKKKKKKLFCIL